MSGSRGCCACCSCNRKLPPSHPRLSTSNSSRTASPRSRAAAQPQRQLPRNCRRRTPPVPRVAQARAPLQWVRLSLCKRNGALHALIPSGALNIPIALEITCWNTCHLRACAQMRQNNNSELHKACRRNMLRHSFEVCGSSVSAVRSNAGKPAKRRLSEHQVHQMAAAALAENEGDASAALSQLVTRAFNREPAE